MHNPVRQALSSLEIIAEAATVLGSHSDIQLFLLLPGWMRQHPLRDSRGIQAGKGSSWGKGKRNESYKKGGLKAAANVMSWDKYGHWSQRDQLKFQLHCFLCGLGNIN